MQTPSLTWKFPLVPAPDSGPFRHQEAWTFCAHGVLDDNHVEEEDEEVSYEGLYHSHVNERVGEERTVLGEYDGTSDEYEDDVGAEGQGDHQRALDGGLLSNIEAGEHLGKIVSHPTAAVCNDDKHQASDDNVDDSQVSRV